MERQDVSRDYLHTCAGLHAQLMRIRYGYAHGINRIEGASAGIRSSRRLTYEDINTIRNNDVWNADVFGYWPSRTEIESALESTTWDFWNLPKREDEAIEHLFQVFRQIEPVSVILRFAVPKHYGIISPPVEHVLGLGSFRRHTDRYHAYLAELRKLRDIRGFANAANVDMALWVLQVGVLDGLLRTHLPEKNYKALKEGFEQDSELREIWAGNLTRRLFSNIPRADLAEALLKTDICLAGQIAGIEFEWSVKKFLGAGPDDKLGELVYGRLPQRVREIYQDGRAATRICIRCKEAVRTRNRAVHSHQALKNEEVVRLIECTSSVSGLPPKIQFFGLYFEHEYGISLG